MTVSPLAKKLLIKPEQRAVVINAPKEVLPLLRPLPKDAKLETKFTHDAEFLLLFVKNVAELQELGPRAVRSIKHDAMLWIAYPKKSSKLKSDIIRDVGWDIIEKAGLEGVAQIAVDETWSASRFRPKELVGKGRKS